MSKDATLVPGLSLKKLSGFFSYGAAAAALQASKFGSTLLAAALLGPKVFAPWIILNTLLNYSSLMSFGLLSGLSRELPLFRGQQEHSRALALIQASTRFLFGLCAIYVGLAVLGFPFRPAMLTPELYITFITLLFANHLYGFMHSVSHSFFLYRPLTWQMFAFAALLPVAVLACSHAFGLAGFIVSNIGLMLASAGFLAWITSGEGITLIGPHLDVRQHIRHLLQVGFPLAVIGLLFTLLTSIDRWAVGSFLGSQELGYFALSVFCVNSLSILTKMVSMQFYPRMVFRFGESGRPGDLKSLVWGQFLSNAILMIGVSVAFYMLVGPLVARFMPEYLPGVPAAKITMLGVVALACVNPFGAMLNAVGHNRPYFMAQVVAILIGTGLIFVAAQQFRTLEAVAMASAVSYGVYMLSMVVIGCSVLYGLLQTPYRHSTASEVKKASTGVFIP